MIKRTMGIPGVILLALLWFLSGTAAATDYPIESGKLETNKTTGLTQGSTVLVQGSGYLPGATVTITIESDPITLKTTTADATGAFSESVVIPANLAAGNHTLKSTGLSPTGTLVLSQAVVVTQIGGTGTGTDTGAGAGTGTGTGAATGDSGGALALTGRSVATTLLLALALGATGYGMVVVSRRVRHS